MPKIVDHEAYRREIIEGATQAFVEQGYGGLGMRELAKQLGISKSALYHYFPSKEALFRAVVETVVQTDIARLDTEALAGAPFSDRLATFIDHIVESEALYARDFLILTEYVRVREGDEGADSMQEAAQLYVQGIRDFLGIGEGDAWALYLQITGAILQRFYDGGRSDLRAMLQWMIEQLNQTYSGGEAAS